jgi:hypothetical protein
MCTHANPLPVLSVRSFAHFARQCVRVSLDRSKLRNTTSTQDTVGTRMDCRPPYLAIAPAPIVHPLPSGRKSLEEFVPECVLYFQQASTMCGRIGRKKMLLCLPVSY